MRPITFQIGYEASISLPLTFIDRYMPACTPVYALIYIYGLRHSIEGGPSLTTQEIGEAFHILETDVLNAWKYWETQKLVKLDTQGESLSIEFLPFPRNQDLHQDSHQTYDDDTSKYGSYESAKGHDNYDKNLVNDGSHRQPDPQKSSQRPMENQRQEVQRPVFNISVRPQYSMEELTFYREQSEDIAKLFSHGEQTLAKMLTYHDLNVLFGFYDWLRLPIDVILYLLTYCSEGGHRDLRYVEKAALDWAERGINTVDEAMKYTQTFDRDFRAIMLALGHPSAFPSPTQRKYMQKWLYEFEMPLDLILDACDKTAVQLGKPKLTYIDKIIADWHKRGIKSLDEVAQAEADWQKAEKSENKDSGRSKPTKRNRFANFKGRERDYAEIERMEQEYLIKSLEG